jgi:hypothetical protein
VIIFYSIGGDKGKRGLETSGMIFEILFQFFGQMISWGAKNHPDVNPSILW